LEVKVNFKEEDDYLLSDISKLDYEDNGGKAKVLDFDKLSINVASPNYRIDTVTAEKSYLGEALNGIKVDWNGNSLSNTGAIKEFEVMRSISGSTFEKIFAQNKSVFEYLDVFDEEGSIKGRYIYRIDTILNNGERVVGIPSNEVLLKGSGKTNICASSIDGKFKINGVAVKSVFETYSLGYEIELTIVDGDVGVSDGGIVNPLFTIDLNTNEDSNVAFVINRDTITLRNSKNKTFEVTPKINNNGTDTAQIVIPYNGGLDAETYIIMFDAETKRIDKNEDLPKTGIDIDMALNIKWNDKGEPNLNNSDSIFDGEGKLQYKIKIMPLPKLM
jgi:hypothetical protein